MKHFRLLIPLLVLALLLSGCAGEPMPYEYVQGDISVTVDPVKHTITHEENVYLYGVEKFDTRTEYVIQYPNGAIYYWTATGNGGSGGWSDDYDEFRYIPGDFLVDALRQSVSQISPSREKKGNFGIGLLLMGLGAVNFFIPELAFYLRYGWAVENAEPSDAYITWTKIGGVLAAIIGLIWCII